MEGRSEENDKGELQSNEVRGKGRWTTLGPGGGRGRDGEGYSFNIPSAYRHFSYITTEQFTDKLCSTEVNMMVHWIA